MWLKLIQLFPHLTNSTSLNDLVSREQLVTVKEQLEVLVFTLISHHVDQFEAKYNVVLATSSTVCAFWSLTP